MVEAWRKPFASTEAVSRRMSRQPRRDTAPELALRRELHRLGLRYYVDRQPLPTLRRRADLVFPRRRVAVFVDGCFWHGCPEHGTNPRTNAWYWSPKIDGNRARDADTDRQLDLAGWTSVRVWEHEEPEEAARRVAGAVADPKQEAAEQSDPRSHQP